MATKKQAKLTKNNIKNNQKLLKAQHDWILGKNTVDTYLKGTEAKKAIENPSKKQVRLMNDITYLWRKWILHGKNYID